MAEIAKCTCGSEPVWVRSKGRFIIARPNKACDINICNYPTKDEAVRRWNEEVERFASTRKGN